MAFANPATKGRTGTMAAAVGLFLLSSDFIRFYSASVARAAVLGRAPGSLED